MTILIGIGQYPVTEWGSAKLTRIAAIILIFCATTGGSLYG
jgi:hypothetical protein